MPAKFFEHMEIPWQRTNSAAQLKIMQPAEKLWALVINTTNATFRALTYSIIFQTAPVNSHVSSEPNISENTTYTIYDWRN